MFKNEKVAAPAGDKHKPSFDGLGIAPKLLQILDSNKFVHPTPIQHQAIPVAIQGTDVLGIAQTGTGKTLAFGVPMLQRLVTTKGRGLVILPTRELALQVDENLNKIGKSLGLKTAILIGGESMNKQVRQLRQNPHVLIGTPGRLLDHLEQKTLRLEHVTVLVLDEADRMLDMGFEPQIKRILASVPKERQTMLFSATMPAEIVHIANSYMKLPVRVEVAPAGTATKNVTQEVFFVHKQNKPQLLGKLLEEYKGSVLVFTRTKFGAKKLAAVLRRLGTSAAEIHSNRSLNQRLEALEGFKIGRYRVLVATDIAARGLDVTGIELVVNYDLPEQPSDYVHRIGRTGRASHEGHAISFATPEQKQDVWQIERLIKKQLPVSPLPHMTNVQAVAPAPMHAAAQKNFRSGSKYSRFQNSGFRKSKAAPPPSHKPLSPQQPVLAGSRGETGRGYFISKPAFAKKKAFKKKPKAFGNYRPAGKHRTSHTDNQF